MRSLIYTAAALLACLAWTQGPDVPRLGWMRSSSGALRPVRGFAGNFVPGEPVLEQVIFAASSGSWTMAKTDREFVLLGRDGDEMARLPAARGAALFAFTPGGEPAAAYFPGDGSLLLWSEGRFRTASWRLAGGDSVLAISCPETATISSAELRGDRVWQVNHDAATGRATLEWLLPGAAAPLLLCAGGDVVYSAARALVRRAPDGSEQRVELPGAVTTLARMGDAWVSAVTAKGTFAVRFAGIEPAVFELPGGAE